VSVNKNLNYTSEGVNENLEKDLTMEKLRRELMKRFDEYRSTMAYLAADAPIGTLCLPKRVEKCLLDHGLLRIYELFNCDFTKIEGLNDVLIRDLTTRLNEFLSML
jgi:hypothetical protein